MNNKNFKIKPKTWPKEYTFEEFKRLNPNVNENILINYYNKYLNEYAEDRSKHINHFNDVKDNLSEEIRSLKNKKLWSFDGDQTVGPTGAGRQFRSPLNPNKNALHFDGVDDVVSLNFINEGRLPADGTLKPRKGLTVAVWVNTSYVSSTTAIHYQQHHIIGAFSPQSGWKIINDYGKISFQMYHDKGNGTPPLFITVRNSYMGLVNNPSNPKQDFREDCWHHIIGTWDGKTQILYLDGKEASGNGYSSSPTFNNTHHKWDMYEGNSLHTHMQSYGVAEDTYATTEGSVGSIYYPENTGTYVDGGALVNASIGRRAAVIGNGNGNHLGYYDNAWSGSIAEAAVWDEALDATTINELWHNGISGSAPKFDLSHRGYNNGENHHDHIYDVVDEGLNYKNIGRYAESLQGWWRLEEGTGFEREMIANGDMELNSNWVAHGDATNVEQSTTQKHGGSNSFKFTVNSTGDGIKPSASLSVEKGAFYKMSWWVYIVGVTNGVTWTQTAGYGGAGAVKFLHNGSPYAGKSIATNTWVYVEFDFKALVNTPILPRFGNGGAYTDNNVPTTYFIDDISIRKYFNYPQYPNPILKDSSGKNRNGELVNSPSWSGSYAPGI